MILFRAYFDEQIQELEVIKQSEKQVVYINDKGNELRENKTGSYWSWHSSKEEAKQQILLNYTKNIEDLQKSISYQMAKMKKIESI